MMPGLDISHYPPNKINEMNTPQNPISCSSQRFWIFCVIASFFIFYSCSQPPNVHLDIVSFPVLGDPFAGNFASVNQSDWDIPSVCYFLYFQFYLWARRRDLYKNSKLLVTYQTSQFVVPSEEHIFEICNMKRNLVFWIFCWACNITKKYLISVGFHVIIKGGL